MNELATAISPKELLSINYEHIYFEYQDTVLLHNNILEKNIFQKKFIDLIVTSPLYNVGIEYKSNDDDLSYEHYLQFSER